MLVVIFWGPKWPNNILKILNKANDFSSNIAKTNFLTTLTDFGKKIMVLHDFSRNRERRKKKKTRFQVAKSGSLGPVEHMLKKIWSPKFITDIDQRSHNLCHLYPDNGLQFGVFLVFPRSK